MQNLDLSHFPEFIQKSFLDNDLEKATYANTWQNRKLGRVGQQIKGGGENEEKRKFAIHRGHLGTLSNINLVRGTADFSKYGNQTPHEVRLDSVQEIKQKENVDSFKESEEDQPYGADMDDALLNDRLTFYQGKEKEARDRGIPFSDHSKVRALEKEWSKRNAAKWAASKK